jgi:hypothetical protein
MPNTVGGPSTTAQYSLTLTNESSTVSSQLDIYPGDMTEAEMVAAAKGMFDGGPGALQIHLGKSVTTTTYEEVDLSEESPAFTIGE